MSPSIRSDPGVAFVLSGGASLGAIQVGMLRALAERDIRPDVIVGTSVGAVNGAFLADRDFGPAAVDELAELWRGVRRGNVFPLEPLTGLLGFLGARKNLVPGTALRRLVSRHVSHEFLEDLPTALHVVACDLLRGEEVVLSSGPLVDAVLASAAIPGVLPPVKWDGRLLVDGGVLNNTPITHALALGAREIYVLPTGGPCELSEPPHGALGMVVQATSLMVAHRFAADLAELAGRPELIVLPPPCPIDVQPMDFGHADELIARAEADARAFLEDRRFIATRTRAPRRGRRGCQGARAARPRGTGRGSPPSARG
jgi:NTE family protein